MSSVPILHIGERKRLLPVSARKRCYDNRGHIVLPWEQGACSVFSCGAIFVTENSDIANVVYRLFYDERFSKNEVNFAIKDVDLTAVLWFNSFRKQKKIPVTKLLENAYAACAPTKAVMQAFLEEINRLGGNEEISWESAVLLRTQLPSRGCKNLKLCIISKELQNLLPDDAFAGCDRKPEEIVSNPEHRTYRTKFKITATVKPGINKVEIPISLEDKDIGAITLACSVDGVMASVSGYDNTKIIAQCYNTGAEEVKAEIEALVALLQVNIIRSRGH